MIYLIHGKNQVDSRRYLLKLKSSFENVEVINDKNLDLKNLKQKLTEKSLSIFGGKSAVIIENFSGKFEIVPKNLDKDLDLILWSGKKIEKVPGFIKSLSFDRISKPTAFKLADAVLLRREAQAQIILNELLGEKENNENILFALVRGFCLVYAAKDGSLKKARVAKFVEEKAFDQANFWKPASIKKALAQLLLVDLALKDGRKEAPLFTTLISKLVTA